MARAFNGPQLDAARACAACVEGRGGRRLALVQGPPGTGKTHCVLGILAAAFGAAPPTGATIAPPRLGGTTLPSATPAARNSRRILLCAPSHCAVDELVRRVATSGILSSSGGTFRPSLLRLGPVAAIAAASRPFALALRARAEGRDGDRPRPGEASPKRPPRARLLAEAQLVACTLSGAGADDVSSGGRFDLVVVDEATQGTDAALMIAMQHADACVLVGDHRQLPPTVLSAAAMRGGFGRSLFDRLVAQGEPASLLTLQYRMHPALSAFPSAQFYGGQLRDAVAAADRPPPAGLPIAGAPLAFVAVRGGAEETRGRSKCNRKEAEAVAAAVTALLRGGGVAADGVGVISAYAAQTRMIERALGKALPAAAAAMVEVSTVDGFQGREKEVILLSCVRASERGGLGFLADARRVNVSITRARRALVVFGHAETLRRDRKTWRAFLDAGVPTVDA